MKRFICSCLAIALSFLAMAADFDILIKTNSEKIEALIQEVSDTEVRYRKASNPTGPVFVISMSELATIIYANGDVQAINASAVPTTSSMATTTPTAQQPMSNTGKFDHIFNDYKQTEQYQKKERSKRTYEWEQFIMANYACFITPYQYNQHAVGLSYGQVKLFGWYVNALLGMGFQYGYTGTGPYVEYNYNQVYPFYTGKISQNLVSVSGGGVARLVIPLYVYAGLGYTYHSTTAEIVGGDWILLDPYQYEDANGHLLNADIGLQAQYKGFTFSVGYMILASMEHENTVLHGFKLGIGYTFKVKK